MNKKEFNWLDLTLSLGGYPKTEPSLSLSSSSAALNMQNHNHQQKIIWNRLLHSYEQKSETESCMRAIKVNREPLAANCSPESSVIGKRNTRDGSSGDNNEGERDSCSLGNNPEDGGGCNGSRKKLRLSNRQAELLEETFKKHDTLTQSQKQALSKELELSFRQVEVWFQNRRARTKLKQTEKDYTYLKMRCESLTEENHRLQKERQELMGAMKFSPQMNAVPVLTICPSCHHHSFAAAAASSAAASSAIVPSHRQEDPYLNDN